jgi:hypothetical protein
MVLGPVGPALRHKPSRARPQAAAAVEDEVTRNRLFCLGAQIDASVARAITPMRWPPGPQRRPPAYWAECLVTEAQEALTGTVDCKLP